jgi:hypothetical protein
MFVSHTTKSNFMQFGHHVRTDLYVACTNSSVVNAALFFSENIGFGEILMRIRFHNGPVYRVWTEARDHGNLWWLSLGYGEPRQWIDGSNVRYAPNSSAELEQCGWSETGQ